MVGQNILPHSVVNSKPIRTQCISHVVDLVIKGHMIQFALLPNMTPEMLERLSQLWEILRAVVLNNGSGDEIVCVLKQITDAISEMPHVSVSISADEWCQPGFMDSNIEAFDEEELPPLID